MPPLPRPFARRIPIIFQRHSSGAGGGGGNSPFRSYPSPLRLPKEDQEIYEQLQRQFTGAFSTPKPLPSDPTASTSDETGSSAGANSEARVDDRVVVKDSNGEELHPNIRRGAPPEFEGDVNPKTGEVGGPKNEPLRWGASGDWSFNGRVTDF